MTDAQATPKGAALNRFVIYNFSGDVDEISHLFPSERFARIAAVLTAEGRQARILDRASFAGVLRFGAPFMAMLAALPFDGTSGEYEDAVAREADAILAERPDCVLVNLWHGTGFKFSLDVVKRLRRLSPALRILGFGQKVDEFQEDILRVGEGCFDGLLAGLAYNAVRAIARGASPADVPNLIRGAPPATQTNPVEPVSVDEYPPPCYAPAVYDGIEEKAPIYSLTLSNQACPNRCAFCIRPRNYGRVVRKRDVGHVLSEMRTLREDRGITHFRVEDSTPPRGSLSALARAVVDSPLRGKVALSAFSRVDINAAEDFPLLRRAGFLALFFGIESLDDDSLKRLRKGTTCERIGATLRKAHEAGLRTVGSFIFPTPGETRASMDNTLRRIGEMKPWLDSVLVLPAGVQPHTDWALNPDRYGIRLGANYVEEGLIYPVKYLTPFRLWKPFPFTYRLMGREADEVTFDDMVRVQAEFLDVVRNRYGIPPVSDYYFLLADRLGLPPAEATRTIAAHMMSRDYAALRRLFLGDGTECPPAGAGSRHPPAAAQ